MIYDSLTDSLTSGQLGAPPAVNGSAEAWGAYLAALRDEIVASKAGAISAYNTLKQVRSNLGLPFMGGTTGEGNADLGAWSADYEQQVVDLIAMSKVFGDAVNDALAGKRKLSWDDQVKDFAIEGFTSDILRLQYGPNSQPVLVDSSGNETHVSGQVGIPLVVFGLIAGVAVVQSVGIGFLVYKAFQTAQVLAQQKTERTVAEATKKVLDLVEQDKLSPAEGEKTISAINAGAIGLRAAATEPKAKETADIASAVKTIAWVGLGVGVLYVAASVITRMPALGGGGALAGARDNPDSRGNLWDWERELLRDLLKPRIKRVLTSGRPGVVHERHLEELRERGWVTWVQKHPQHQSLADDSYEITATGKAALLGEVERMKKSFGRADNPDYTQFRSSYLPAALCDVTPFTPSGTDLEIWTWEDEQRGKTVFHGIAFAGKAGKPLWHHWFGTAASRMSMIEKSIASRKSHLKWREERTGARKDFKHTLKVGDVLYTSYGYDETHISFYQVVETKEKSVVVCEIGKKVAKAERSYDYVVPVPGECRGKPETKRVGEGNSVKIDDHYAGMWRGEPLHETAMGWGH